MALYYDLPVFKEVYQLTLRLFQLTTDFPREYKFTLGQDLKRDCIILVRYIYRANKKNAKRIARPKVAFTSGIPILVQMLASESIEICFIWSSSQYASNDNNAYKPNFNNGDWNNNKNNNNNYVCAVRDFTQKLFFEKLYLICKSSLQIK